MTICSNCGSEVPSDKSICPNCGATMTQDAILPLDPDDGDLSTPGIHNREGDLMRGFFTSGLLLLVFGVLNLFLLAVLGLGSFLAFGIGMIIAVLSYFDIRKTRPVFARGFGFGLIAIVVAVLSFVKYVLSNWNS